MMQANRFVAIEGNIGAGKTTLTTALAELWDAKLILEQFTDNPFLPLFYKNPERYAFQVELFFMTERHKQLQEAFAAPSLFEPISVADYFFFKTVLFAHNNLTADEFRLFNGLFQVLNSTFRKPDLLVYLHRPVEVLHKHIAQRGRSYETEITLDYLTDIQEQYFSYFRTMQQQPILILDLGSTDMLAPNAFAEFEQLLARDWPIGLHRHQIK
jgi:deoxyguanosine kinase